MLFLLLCPVDGIDIIVWVVIGWYCKHVSTEVVLVVVEVLLRRLPVPVVALLGTAHDVAVEIVLWKRGGSFQGRQVVLRYLQIVVQISGGGIPWCCR